MVLALFLRKNTQSKHLCVFSIGQAPPGKKIHVVTVLPREFYIKLLSLNKSFLQLDKCLIFFRNNPKRQIERIVFVT